jgi:TolB-like protein/DNA-binding winged helix-turn-helix (wHTH) protein/Tfp pilus assembly protein PilF
MAEASEGPSEPHGYEFGPYRLDARGGAVYRGELRLGLPPKAVDVLRLLLEAGGELVPKQDLIEAIWPDVVVEEGNLAKLVYILRQEFESVPEYSGAIQTVPKRGYRFVGPAHEYRGDHRQPVASAAVALDSAADSDARTVVAESTFGLAPALAPLSSAPWRRRWLIALVLLGAVLVAIVALKQSPKLWTREARGAAAVAPSIAVLPFADMSPEQDQGYFADGMAQEIINALSEVPGLQVLARSSSFSFKGKNVDPRTVGKTLGVAHVLEGSIRKTGARVRVTAQLVSTEDGFQLWSQTFDRELGDIFSLQTEIAQTVAGALKVKVLSRVRQRPASPEAYLAYLRGQELLHAGSYSDFPKAIDELKKSVELSPEYAPAHAALAQVLTYYESMIASGQRAYRTSRSDALEQAERAVALDPELATAYEVRGNISKLLFWDLAAAKTDYERALQLAPGRASALAAYSRLLGVFGRLPEAVRYARLAVSLDPLSADPTFSLALWLLMSGDLDGADAMFEKGAALAPRHYGANFLGSSALLKGEAARALTAFRSAPEEWARLLGTALAEHSLGHDQASRDALDRLTERWGHVAQYQVAQVHAWRGEREQAFHWLERAYQERDGGILSIKVDPVFRSLHDDPRYASLLVRLRLPPDAEEERPPTALRPLPRRR